MPAEPDLGRRPFCAATSSERGESLTATASRVDHWILVEYRGGWSRDLIDGSLLFAIARDQNGQPSVSTNTLCENSARVARTGTNSDGTAAAETCSNFTSNADDLLGVIGRSATNTVTWSNCSTAPCNTLLPIYCFQQ